MEGLKTGVELLQAKLRFLKHNDVALGVDLVGGLLYKKRIPFTEIKDRKQLH